MALIMFDNLNDREFSGSFGRLCFILICGALAVVTLDGNPHHFDERLFAVKPHPGQQQVAARLRGDLAADRTLPWRAADAIDPTDMTRIRWFAAAGAEPFG